MNKPFTLRLLLAFLVFLVFISQSNAQVFQKNYSLTGLIPNIAFNFTESVQQTSDGGFVFQGWNMSYVPTMELVKTNNLGVVTWKKEYNACIAAPPFCFNADPTSNSMGGCIQQTSDGGYIMTGSLNSSLVLAKVTSTGAFTWAKTFGTNSYGKYVRITSDGGYICVGYEGSNVFVVRTTSTGALLWQNAYQIGNYIDEATDVDQISNGQFVVTGYSTIIYNPGASADTTDNVFVIRFDQAGGILSSNSYGLDGESEEGQSITKTSDGGYIVSGSTTQTAFASPTDVFLWKFAGDDSPLFQNNYKLGGIFSIDMNFNYAAQETSDGGYAMFGVATGFNLTTISSFSNFMLKLNNSGDTMFGKAYKDSAFGSSFSMGYTIWNDGKQMANGGYVVGGSGIPISAGTGLGFKLIKTNSVGESGCSENNIHPVKYSQPFAPTGLTLTNVATGATADVYLFAADPLVVEEEVCMVSCKARPGNDTTICEGTGPFQLGMYPAAINGMPPYTYTWSPAAGLDATNIPNPLYTPTTDATYTLEIHDSEGCSSTQSIAITIAPLPTTDAGLPKSICTGTSATLIATATPPGSAFAWSNSAGNNDTVTVSPTITTTYTVFVTDAFNCGTASDNVVVTVVPPPTVTSGVGNVCVGDIFQTNLTITNSSSVAWTTSGTGSFSSNTAQTPTYTPSPADIAAGTVTLTVNVIGNAPCGNASGTIVLTIKPLPPAPVFTNVIPAHCANDAPFPVTGATPSGGTYSGLGVSNNIFSPTIAGPGTHPIIYTYTGPNGCKNSDTNTVSIIPIPIVTLGNFDTICVNGSPVSLSGGSPLGGTFSGAGVSGTTFNPAVAGVGLHTIRYTYTNSTNCSSSDSSKIYVGPAVVLTSIPDSSIYLELGQVVTFTATPAISGTYNFNFLVDSVSKQNGTNHIYASNTLETGQTVLVILNNACSDSIQIKLKPVPNAFIPTSVHPNNIFMPHVDLTIINRWGQEIYKGTDGWNGKYKEQNASPGTYFYVIKIVGLDTVEKQYTGTVTLVAK